MNELVNIFGYDSYYIKINIGSSVGISITPEGARRPTYNLWHYDLTSVFKDGIIT